MGTFDNVEVYVRIADYGYEGESVRFATVNENQALTFFNEDIDSATYAPDSSGEELVVYVGGNWVEKWYRQNGKWVKDYLSKDPEEYGTVKVRES